MKQRCLRRTIRWLLAIAIVVFLVTGFGITEFRVVETMTFGWLTKSVAFRIHTSLALWVPLLVLLVLHIGSSYIFRAGSRGGATKTGLN